MLAAELALAGVDVAIVERRTSQHVESARAGGLHARTIEILDQRGIADRFLAEGTKAQVTSYATHLLDISDFPTRHNYGLALWQNHFERILAGWVGELPVAFHRGCEVSGFTQHDDHVEIALSDQRTLRARYLVGCDGGRSVIRKHAGIDFPGWDASISYLIAEGATTETPPWGIRRDDRGVHGIGKLEDGRVRLVSVEQQIHHDDSPTLDELRTSLTAVYGTDFGIRDVTWLSRFTDATRQAASYRTGRVLLAGDAAHIHSPAGGQGLNMGIHDAVNLGWKLAQVVHGTSPETLLDTYQAERHPITARLLETTMATTAINRGDARTGFLRAAMADLLAMPEPRKRYAGLMSGLDVRYDFDATDTTPADATPADATPADVKPAALHPLVGRRMPDLDILTAAGPTRVFTLLHDARPVLLNLGAPGTFAAATAVSSAAASPASSSKVSRLRVVEARYDGGWELPVIGAVVASTAVLIRPDGHVAWVGEAVDASLRSVIVRWFGDSTLDHTS